MDAVASFHFDDVVSVKGPDFLFDLGEDKEFLRGTEEIGSVVLQGQTEFATQSAEKSGTSKDIKGTLSSVFIFSRMQEYFILGCRLYYSRRLGATPRKK